MPVTKEQLTELRRPFLPCEIQFRVGQVHRPTKRGKPLAYIDARAVQERFDSVLGPENWRVEYVCQEYTVYKVNETTNQKEEFKSHAWMANIYIHVKGEDNDFSNEWICKSDGAEQTQMEQVKGGMSDAFKRAAVAWGVGRSLYALEIDWVDVTQKGRTFIIPKSTVIPIPQWYLDGLMMDPMKQQQGQASNFEGGFDTGDGPVADQRPAPEVAPPTMEIPASTENPFGAPAAPVPTGFPAGVDPHAAIGFGKKVLDVGRPVGTVTWGEISKLPSGHDARQYVEWMAKKCAENRASGERIHPAMVNAEKMVGFLMAADVASATGGAPVNTDPSVEEMQQHDW